jgi:hypothetical protein
MNSRRRIKASEKNELNKILKMVRKKSVNRNTSRKKRAV